MTTASSNDAGKRQRSWFGGGLKWPTHQMRASRDEDPSIARTPGGSVDEPEIRMFESELQAIARNADEWGHTETGGSLHGWLTGTGNPVVAVATPPGKNARHTSAQFQQDIDYWRKCDAQLLMDYGTVTTGRWHSHHFLSLSGPSGGDQATAASIMKKNPIPVFVELIVTFVGTGQSPGVVVHPYVYVKQSHTVQLVGSRLRILRGLSPIREAAMGSEILQGRDGYSWRFPLDRVRIDGHEAATSIVGTDDGDVPDELIRQIEELPGEVRDQTKVSLRPELTIVSLPLPNNRMVLTGYDRDGSVKPRHVYLHDGARSTNDISGRINPAQSALSLSQILSRARAFLCQSRSGSSSTPLAGGTGPDLLGRRDLREPEGESGVVSMGTASAGLKRTSSAAPVPSPQDDTKRRNEDTRASRTTFRRTRQC